MPAQYCTKTWLYYSLILDREEAHGALPLTTMLFAVDKPRERSSLISVVDTLSTILSFDGQSQSNGQTNGTD